MNLKYPDFDTNSILSSDDLNMTNVNRILNQLNINDNMLANPTGFSPKIWECKWYNDQSISGYPEGYAVWYNTENAESFIEFNANKMYNYAKDNIYLKDVVKRFTFSQIELYKSILTGYHVPGKTITLQPLFDIGQLSAPAQIKISKVDNNKYAPSDSRYWKDFIINDDYESVVQTISSILSILLSSHMNEYHFEDNSISSIIVDYLDNDMSNVKNAQSYQSHTTKKDTEGFDYVKQFVKIPCTMTYYNSVIQDKYITHSWKYKDYDAVADNNGHTTATAKANYIAMMQNCANYISDDVQASIERLQTDAIVDITYNAAKSNSIVPQSTMRFEEISSKAQLYNCTYEVIPLTAAASAFIADNIDKYNHLTNEVSTYYPSVTYTYYRWYRLWNSGYLEHGGIVPILSIGNTYVDFNWKYRKDGNDLIAPSYDYPTQLMSFYGNHTNFSEDRSSEYDYSENLTFDSRYSVSITPIMQTLSSNLSGIDMSYPTNPNAYGNYVSKDANSIKNNGFCIYNDDTNVQFYSYYTSGFKTNI